MLVNAMYSLTVVSCVRLTSLVEFAATSNSTCKLTHFAHPLSLAIAKRIKEREKKNRRKRGKNKKESGHSNRTNLHNR